MLCNKINSAVIAFGVWFIALLMGREILMPGGRVMEHSTGEILVFWLVPLFMVIATAIRMIAVCLVKMKNKNSLATEDCG